VQDTVSQNPAEEGFGNERLITDAREVAAATGGFALIASPGEYRSSGVMTFIVLCKKDLGANTSALASAMTTFHKDANWHAADE
jgi:hypothetical protein